MKASLALLFLILFSISNVWAHEKEVSTKANKFAFGKFSEQKHYPWPFPLLSIGHNMQSYQDYSGSPYWHDGLDIRSHKDQAIYASAGGKVVNIENYVSGNSLYWEVAILDKDGFVWKYHHVARESIPEEVHAAYKNGSEIPQGSFIGNVVKWPVSSFGEVYHHLHLLIVGADGRYINPFLMLSPLEDTQAPIIHQIGLAKNHSPIQGHQVKGEHSLFVEATDLVYHEKFLLPPHKISYRLNNDEEKTVWIFDHLPSGKNDTDYINDFYLKGTCGNYQCRKILINLNFSLKNPRGSFRLNPGDQEIEVIVEDAVGNRATKNFKWTVL